MHKDIKYKEISVEDFSPKLLRCSLFTEGKNMPRGHRLGKRYVYDYELELFTYSSGGMMIEGKIHPVSSGDIVLRKPGQLVEGIMPYSCYLLCFDLLGNTDKDSINYDIYAQSNFQFHYINSFLDSIPPVFHPKSYEIYLNLFDDILKEYINPGSSSPIITKSHILRILYEIQRDLALPSIYDATLPVSPHYNRLKKAIDFVQRNFDKKISLTHMSEAAGLSPTYFHKIFSDALKITPNNYLNKTRLDKAKELLVKTSLPVNQIALKCGFENIPYFSFLFKNSFHISPADFRKKHSYY